MDFVDRLRHRLNQPLPGALAQDKMKARRSSGASISFKHQGPPKRGGVAVLLYQEQGSWYFPLMKRTVYPGIHSGQISLPGGKMETPDRDLTDTALRESQEELGFAIAEDQVIGSLTELYIVASHFQVLPVIAVLESKPQINADEREVEQVLLASLDDLTISGTVKEKDIQVRGYDITAPYFEVDRQMVWGATAMILNEFITILREV